MSRDVRKPVLMVSDQVKQEVNNLDSSVVVGNGASP